MAMSLIFYFDISKVQLWTNTKHISLAYPSDSNKVEPLEAYVERLIHATRLKEAIKKSEWMQATNIQTIIERLDKRLTRQNAGYSVMSHYEKLCEVAHPNVLGVRTLFAGG